MNRNLKILKNIFHCIIICLIAGFQLKAEQPAIIIDSICNVIPVKKEELYLYEDTSASLTLEEVQKKMFKPISTFPNIYQRNYKHSWWTKIIIENQLHAKQTLWVHVSGKYNTAYVQEDSLAIKSFQTGNLVPKSKKAIPFEHKFYNFIPIEIPNKPCTITIWAKVTLPETIAGETDILALTHPLFAQNLYYKNRNIENFINAIFQTVFFLLLFYSIIYYSNTKASFALYMIAYCFVNSFYFLNAENYLYTFSFVSENPLVSNYIHIGLINIMTFFDIQLVRHYLNLKKYLPIWDKIFKILLPISLLVSIGSLITYYFTDNFRLSYVFINSSFSLLFLFIRIGFIIRIFSINRPHRFRIMRIALLIGMVFLLTATAGIIVSFIDGTFFFQLGVVAYIFTIILSLGKDAAIHRQEKIIAEQLQLEQQRILEIQQKELAVTLQQEELSRIRNEELERLDEVKTRFFANVSHELRTPLSLMIGPIQSALNDEQLSNRSFTFLSLAKNNGKQLLKLINQILDLTKLEATGLSVNLQETHLFPFLKRLVAAFASHAEQEGVNLLFDYQLSKDLVFQLDKTKVEVVLNNLLFNAFKFTPSGKQVHFLVKESPNGFLMEISDTGRGIHPDDLPHIFNRFYQSRHKDAQSEGGTGIGLALSKEYVQLMKGKLWVESEWQVGTHFYFELPAIEVIRSLTNKEYQATLSPDNAKRYKPKNIGQPIFIENKAADASQITIMIVEDNADLRLFLQTILTPQYHILTAKNGQVALDILSDRLLQIEDSAVVHPPPLPSVIISDIMMPVMDGFQFLKVLKSKDYFRIIPVIMLTARAGMQDKLKALRIGVDDYLLKPFLDEELLVRISNLLQSFNNRKMTWFKGDSENINQEAPPTKLPTISKEDSDWLRTVEEKILTNLSNPSFSIEDLAYEVGLSRRQLDRRLKKLMALTAGSYVKEIRYGHAKHLLENRTFSSVKTTVYAVGIKDAVNFSRQFKSRFGKLPSEYF